MITQHAQGPGSTAGFFFSKKQNKERKNEREKGEEVNFQDNALAFEVGRWAVEE